MEEYHNGIEQVVSSLHVYELPFTHCYTIKYIIGHSVNWLTWGMSNTSSSHTTFIKRNQLSVMFK